MPADIIARGMAARAGKLAQQALDELSKVVEGTMNEDLTEFTDLEGHVVTPNETSLYLDVEDNIYYRWDADEQKYYASSGADENVKYVQQTLNEEQKEQARSNIGAQEELVDGENLKTVNGASLLGAGNLEIGTWQPFNPSWPTNTTVLALMQAINNDPAAVVGMGYLGEVTCSGLPFNGNAEIRIEILNQSGNQKIMLCQVTSANVYPYHWEATYWSAGLTPWRGFSAGAYIVDYANPNYDEAVQAFNNGRTVFLKGAAPDPNSYALINYVSANYITFSKFLTSRRSTYAAFSSYYLKPDNTWDTGTTASGGQNVFLKTVEANKAIQDGDAPLCALEVGGSNYSILNSEIVESLPAEGIVANKIYLVKNNAPAERLDNLVGTKWLFNSVLDLSGTIVENVSYHINFKDANDTEYNQLSKRGSQRLKYNGTASDVYNEVWAEEAYRTIEIKDGSDADNALLIAFLQKNAALLEYPLIYSYDAYMYNNGWIKISPKIPTSVGELTNDRFVRYDNDEQNLSGAQKKNVRSNIGAAMCRTGTRTLSVANWEDGLQILNIDYVTENDYVHIIGLTDEDEDALDVFGIGFALEDGDIAFSASETPNKDIDIKIAIISGIPL